ncbi:hypothetical protein T07_14458 [Trichinella nelsoni]|uniref:Uncharacterized protein n=1 Tax=Trichinella nelsoni TaxID=6336 RepID=A0A0V0RBZ6_9BILA|nr:hypothetical protein T07_14458 [Trichinella nelsoni]
MKICSSKDIFRGPSNFLMGLNHTDRNRGIRALIRMVLLWC